VFSEPQVPEIDGADRFSGALLHSSEATDPKLFAGRRVVVVGAGKSALDCAAYAASRASECALVFRTPYWMAPRFLPGGIPSDRVLLSRLSESLFRYHRLDGFERLLHGPGKRLARLVMMGVSLQFRLLSRFPAVMVPDDPLPAGIEVLGVASEFYAAARDGGVRCFRGRITSFPGGDELLLSTGERIQADVVIFATGWRQSLAFLDPELKQTVLRGGYLHLFRHILPPNERRLGFVGYASSTACQLTAEISAHWLSQAFHGELDLPDPSEMDIEIDVVKSWLREVIPGRAEGYYVGPHLAHHIGELLGDMGVATRRTSNFLSEYLTPPWPWRYAGLAGERRSARDAAFEPGRRYIGAKHAAAGLAALFAGRAAWRAISH
jgi:cation diffusion facilitator CzcD-associated flavoprotein CzcO